ncbi:MAG TPA: hypothetical protein VGY56_00560 [Verrucomicrobiae bacterium]|nr:hypothetical protein [Verrucomicrobiae bacterium]
MNRIWQFTFVLVVAVVIATIGSHLLIDWTKIKTTVSEPFVFGKPNGQPPAFKAGSSLSDYDIDWNKIAEQTHTEIRAWGVARGSPYEFQQLQKQVPQARTTYIVISAFDMDEANVSDFRAALVPLSETIKSLIAIHAGWSYSKRAISEYPFSWLRALFPTIGRSRDIMGLINKRIHGLLHHSAESSDTPAGPILEVGKEKVADSYRLQHIESLSQSELAGIIASTRASFQGKDAFNGQKFQAFLRMLQYGCERGPTIVVVVPVSSWYSKQFMTSELSNEFEGAIAEAQHRYPKVEWLRLDRVAGLDSGSNFCDIVHMNVYGDQKTTGIVEAWLKQSPHQL